MGGDLRERSIQHTGKAAYCKRLEVMGGSGDEEGSSNGWVTAAEEGRRLGGEGGKSEDWFG